MHLHMRRATPSLYLVLDLCEGHVEHDRAKQLPTRLQLEIKGAISQVIF